MLANNISWPLSDILGFSDALKKPSACIIVAFSKNQFVAQSYISSVVEMLGSIIPFMPSNRNPWMGPQLAIKIYIVSEVSY